MDRLPLGRNVPTADSCTAEICQPYSTTSSARASSQTFVPSEPMLHCENSAPANGLLLPRKSVPSNEGRLPAAL
jgi:hypothetical protein